LTDISILLYAMSSVTLSSDGRLAVCVTYMNDRQCRPTLSVCLAWLGTDCPTTTTSHSCYNSVKPASMNSA